MEIKEAKSFKDRLLGLMFKKNIKYGLFNNCNAIHTFFMFSNIDVYAKDKNDNLIKKYENVKPWRIIIAPIGTKKIIEIPVNKVKD